MICQVIINDFEIGKRTLYILDDADFKLQASRLGDTDALLTALQTNSMFAGRTCWMDLEIRHFHVMIVNLLRLMSGMDDDARSNKDGEPVARMVFFLCNLITLIQQASGSLIDLLRITRVSDDVLYDYYATLDVRIEGDAPRSGLKIVIDNDGC